MMGFEEESLGPVDEEKEATESAVFETEGPIAHEEKEGAGLVGWEAGETTEPAGRETNSPAEPVANEATGVVGFHSTRESLEGAVVNPVQISADEGEHLATGAVGVNPSVKRSKREHTVLDALGSGLGDLEPRTKASARAAGTARLMSEAPEAEGDKASAEDNEDPEKDASGLDSEKDGKMVASGLQFSKRRIPLPAKVLIVLFVLLIAAAGLVWSWISGIERSMGISGEDRADLERVLVRPAQEEQDEAFYMLIIGSDARGEGEPSRSDVIMLTRVDPSKGIVTLVSIPRDTMIYRDDGSIEKINAEYNYGPAATVRAVSEFAGVDIAHYVEVDFEGLEQVVDALGGVKVDIPNDIIAKNGGISFSAGEQVLNGEEALSYARNRYDVVGGDFGRAQAQRRIASAIVTQVLSSSPAEMPTLISRLAECISTDLSVSDIIVYALKFQQLETPTTIFAAVTPSYAINQNGISYVATMYDEWQNMMCRVDVGLDPNDETADIPDQRLDDDRLGSAINGAGPRDYEGLAADSSLTTRDVK